MSSSNISLSLKALRSWQGSPTLADYNGHLTITSPTGNHRTFRIWTGAIDDWTRGRRVLSLLSSGGVWVAFGWVDSDGLIRVFVKKQSQGLWMKYARMLQVPGGFMAKGAIYEFEGHCRRCNRILTHPDSLHRGLGPHCAKILGVTS